MELRHLLGNSAFVAAGLVLLGDQWWQQAPERARARSATPHVRVGRSDVERSLRWSTPGPEEVSLTFGTAGLTVASAAHEDPEQRALLQVRRQFTDAYLAGHPSTDPLVSPVRGDWSGLPPLLIQAATGDVLASDAELIDDRARADGVPAILELYPADAHVFQLFWSFLPEAAEAVEAAGRFLAEPSALSRASDPTG